MLMNYSNNNDNKETSFFQRKEKNTNYNLLFFQCQIVDKLYGLGAQSNVIHFNRILFF